MRFKKGSDKPIEIFVGMFIIIAVAMIMLAVFREQVSEQQGELADQQRESNLQLQLRNAGITCNELCTNAKTQKCSTPAVNMYCVRQQKIDFNGDGDYSDSDTSAAIIGVAAVPEDQVRCYHLTECTCDVPLDQVKCNP
ncbi:hypothetical protein H6504_01990 [Candidatus Woesearchaeota archaeon]|nr:hypothetical protein [Candidatus Woesearchaeota archaeon]